MNPGDMMGLEVGRLYIPLAKVHTAIQPFVGGYKPAYLQNSIPENGRYLATIQSLRLKVD